MNTQLCTIRIETLGCRLNQTEAESFAALCTDAGFSLYHNHTGYYGASNTTRGISAGAAELPPLHDAAAMHSALRRAQPVTGIGNIPEQGTSAQPLAEEDIATAFATQQEAAPKDPCFSVSLPPEHTVLCFVNTCTVTGKAEQKARRLIRLLAKTHPQAVILVTGCYAQLEAIEIEALHPHVIAFPGQQKDVLTALPAYLADLVQSSASPDTVLLLSALRTFLTSLTAKEINGTPTFDAPPAQPVHNVLYPARQNRQLFALSASRFLFHSRAFLKIQDGCNAACAYCRIRLARGKSVSLPAADVIARLRSIEKAGIPEVTLSGVNLSQYRSEAGDFAGLLKLILEKSRIRIRISSLYPDRIDEALIPLLGHPQVCPHFHLSVQSGSNAVLRKMRRSYTRETIYRAVTELRRIKDYPFIGVDIITGFPGETDDDFEDTYRMCSELSFAGIHAFPFSARPGTEAWNMQPKIPERVAGQRVKKLNGLAERQAAAYLQAWDGKTVYGVTEAPRNGLHTVITENYLSLPLTEHSLHGAAVLYGGEYVRIRVQGNQAELLEVSGTRPLQRSANG